MNDLSVLSELLIAPINPSSDLALFQAAFGNSTISSQSVSFALAQFVRSMVSYQSKYDQGVASGFTNFSTLEQLGRQLFNSNRTQCSSCHQGHLQILDRARNNGLDAVSQDNGAGNGEFKSPSLRNIAIRAPFMHDGRFTSLQQVVAFYNGGVQDNPDLDDRLRRDNRPIRMGLNATEQAALVAFLNTLTDTNLTSDPKFSNPFISVEVPEEPAPNVNHAALSAIVNLLFDDE